MLPAFRGTVLAALARNPGLSPPSSTNKVVLLDPHVNSPDAGPARCTREAFPAVLRDPCSVCDEGRRVVYGWYAGETPESQQTVLSAVNQGWGSVFSTKGVLVHVDDFPTPYFIEFNRTEDDRLIKMATQDVSADDAGSKHLSGSTRSKIILQGRHFLCCPDSRLAHTSKNGGERLKSINTLAGAIRKSSPLDGDMIQKLIEFIQSRATVPADTAEPETKRRKVVGVEEASTEELVDELVARLKRGEPHGARIAGRVTIASRYALVKSGHIPPKQKAVWMAFMHAACKRHGEALAVPTTVADLMGVTDPDARKHLEKRESEIETEEDFEALLQSAMLARTHASPPATNVFPHILGALGIHL